eukprot:1014958-Prorocentrum_minimum.AAC.2
MAKGTCHSNPFGSTWQNPLYDLVGPPIVDQVREKGVQRGHVRCPEGGVRKGVQRGIKGGLKGVRKGVQRGIKGSSQPRAPSLMTRSHLDDTFVSSPLYVLPNPAFSLQ